MLGTLTIMDTWPAGLGFVQSAKDRKVWTRGTVTLTRQTPSKWRVSREDWAGSRNLDSGKRSGEAIMADLIEQLSTYLRGQ